MAQDLDTDRPNRVPWPPIIYVVALMAAYGLERFWPMAALALPVPKAAGIGLALAGIAIAVSGAAYFGSIGTSFDPTARAKALGTGGPYRYTRNPMYVGGIVFFTGVALAFASGWLLAFVPLIALALQKLAIEPEEAYLTRRFGEEYRAYCAKVRRWV